MKTLQRKSIDYRRVRKIRNRWNLFVTLHNNPSLREHRRSELFVERSAFAAFGIMVQRGVVQFSDTTIERERDEKFDTNLKVKGLKEEFVTKDSSIDVLVHLLRINN